MKEKTPLSHEVVCVQMVDLKTSSSKLEVLKSNSWKITSFSKTMALQREPFLTMFYTINLSPLLVTKKVFMLIIILSNYQQCPLPLRTQRFDQYSLVIHNYAASSNRVHRTSEDDQIEPRANRTRFFFFLRTNTTQKGTCTWQAYYHKKIIQTKAADWSMMKKTPVGKRPSPGY